MPRDTIAVDLTQDGYPVRPNSSYGVRHSTTFDALIARDFLGLALRRHYIGPRDIGHWVFQAAFKQDQDDGSHKVGPMRDIPPWSVSGDEALYLLDFVHDFELGTTAKGVRCSLWINLTHPDNSTAMFDVSTYGEADKDEFGTAEDWMRHQGREIGYGPLIGLAICRAAYQATQDMNDVMTELHHANIRRILNTARWE